MKKVFVASLLLASCCITQGQVKLALKDSSKQVISRHIYGHFAEHLGRCIYDGIIRNGAIRKDIVNALKQIQVPNLRWPGGCFADEYHWRDGIGERSKRPARINTTWGMVKEDNSFGTHEFLDLCEQIGCEPYFAGNVGTGTPQEMANWIEYLNLTPDPSPTGEGRSSELSELRAKNGHPASYKVSFWGVGNESWGCGGDMTPAYYADLYKHYANFCKTYPGNPRLKKIVSGANADDYNWTETIMKNIPTHLMWGVSLHYYTWLTGHWPPSGSATSFTEKEYFQAMNQALRMEEILNKHEAIMDKYDPAKKVALLVDEWGIWTAAEPGTNPAFLYQQNSLRDALIAGTTLNIFNNHCDRVKVANLAQAVNVIHSVILTKGDSMVLTPTYHVFDLYKVHQDARLLPVKFTTPYYVNGKDSVQAVNISASKDSTGTVHISLVNIDANKAIEVEVELPSGTKGTITGRILTSAKVDDYNDFGKAEKVGIKAFTGFKKVGGVVKVVLPSKCVVVMEIR